jgi:hypothetical protein
MKLLIFLLVFPAFALAQGKNISFAKKSIEPIVTSQNDTLKVEQEIKIGIGSNVDGSFKYVSFLNSFNEPIKLADSRAAMKKQQVLFFKEQDGTIYLFTKYFVVNIEAALVSKEIIIK